MWYDELIVSRSRIPDPHGVGAPFPGSKSGRNAGTRCRSAVAAPLSWSASNATSCTGIGRLVRQQGGLDGSQVMSNLTADKHYVLTCTGVRAAAARQRRRTPSPRPCRRQRSSANPTTVDYDGSSTLTWSSTNAASCTASGDWSGNKAISGSQVMTINNITADKHYVITCTGTGGVRDDSADVTVAIPRPAVTLDGEPHARRRRRQLHTHRGRARDATSCTASGDWSGSKAARRQPGVQQSSPLTRHYVLTCTGHGWQRRRRRRRHGERSRRRPVTLTANPTATSTAAAARRLTWSTHERDELHGVGRLVRQQGRLGQSTFNNLTADSTTCSPARARAAAPTTTPTSPSVIAQPTVTLTANPDRRLHNGSSTLTVVEHQCDELHGIRRVVGHKPVSGSQVMTNTDRRQALRAHLHRHGRQRMTRDVAVRDAVPGVTLTANPTESATTAARRSAGRARTRRLAPRLASWSGNKALIAAVRPSAISPRTSSTCSRARARAAARTTTPASTSDRSRQSSSLTASREDEVAFRGERDAQLDDDRCGSVHRVR